jgi:hypothetical protein
MRALADVAFANDSIARCDTLMRIMRALAGAVFSDGSIA